MATEKTYLLVHHTKERGVNNFVFNTVNKEIVDKVQKRESVPMQHFGIFCNRIQDFPPSLIEIENGEIISIEEYQSLEWLKQKLLE